jgi:enoyl-CoA hydratase/carnithine racemase
VEIDHPPVNALNRAVIDGLADAFVAGADIREFPLDAGVPDARSMLRLPSVLADIAAFPKPVIARIHGHCLGGGLEVAMACDIRVAAADASLGQPEVKLGLIPGAGGTQRLPRLVGSGRAFLLNVTGEPISGECAYEWGLVERVVPAAELDAAVDELAQVIAAQSPASVSALKELHVTTSESSLGDGLASEGATFVRCLLSEDGREGVTAFLEKRAPAWNGS